MSKRLKIFVLLSRIPYPLIKGDKLRAFNQIKSLSEHHDIYLCALSDQSIPQKAASFLKPYCKEIHFLKLSKVGIAFNVTYALLFGKKPLQVNYFYQRSIHQKIKRLIDRIQPDHLYCQLIRTAEYIRHENSFPKTIDFMDSLSSGMQRRYEKAKGLKKVIFQIEMIRLKRYEHFVFNDFDYKTIISERDRDLIVNYKNDSIVVVENGVDFNYYLPEESNKKYELLFTGNMSYPPNVEAVLYLISDILPLIKRDLPEIKLLVAGANPGRILKEKAGKEVEFTGWMEDIRSAYNSSKVFIAPMEIGSGLQNKLLEAMAMKLPCITSDLANRSLKAEEGEAILIGRSAEEYAKHAIMLLSDDKLASEIAKNGYNFVKGNFNWEKSILKLIEIFEKKERND